MTPAEALKREQAKAKREKLEAALWQQIKAECPLEALGCERQFKFHPKRKWALDFAFPVMTEDGLKPWIAVEVDGGTWTGGRHTRGAGYAADCEKLNEAACLGWTVLRVTGDHIKSGQAIDWIRRVLE